MLTPFEWDPQDPRSASPVPGEPGHFKHHDWLKEFALLMFVEMQESHKKIASLEARIKKLEGRL